MQTVAGSLHTQYKHIHILSSGREGRGLHLLNALNVMLHQRVCLPCRWELIESILMNGTAAFCDVLFSAH